MRKSKAVSWLSTWGWRIGMDQRKARGIKNALLERDTYVYYFGSGGKHGSCFSNIGKLAQREEYFIL